MPTACPRLCSDRVPLDRATARPALSAAAERRKLRNPSAPPRFPATAGRTRVFPPLRSTQVSHGDPRRTCSSPIPRTRPRRPNGGTRPRRATRCIGTASFVESPSPAADDRFDPGTVGGPAIAHATRVPSTTASRSPTPRSTGADVSAGRHAPRPQSSGRARLPEPWMLVFAQGPLTPRPEPGTPPAGKALVQPTHQGSSRR